MNPNLPMNYQVNGHRANIKCPINIGLHFTTGISPSYFDYLFFGQFRHRMVASAPRVLGVFLKPKSPFICAVSHIVGLCSQKQMARIAALPIVTLMKNPNSFLGEPIINRPSETAGGYRACASWSFVKMSIPIRIKSASPLPASSKLWNMRRNWANLVNFAPKSLWGSYGKSLFQHPRLNRFFGSGHNIYTILIRQPFQMLHTSAMAFLLSHIQTESQ